MFGGGYETYVLFMDIEMDYINALIVLMYDVCDVCDVCIYDDDF